MEAWMRIGQPLEPVMADYQRIFDAWEEGGVRGLVVGRLLFQDEHGKFTIPAIPCRSEAYTRRGMTATAGRDPDPVREAQLHRMLEDAGQRG
jgi:hypothetical protein